MSVLRFESFWLVTAIVILVPAIYVAVCRQVFAVFSRKALLEPLPEERQEAMERFLDRDDDYEASLRTLDHVLRLCLTLSLAVGRFAYLSALPGFSVWDRVTSAVAWLLLVGEVAVVLVVFLEVVPGIVARLRPESLLRRLIHGIDRVHRCVEPVRKIPGAFVRVFVRLLGGADARTSADMIEEEILSAAEEGEREGVLESRDIDMIEAVITFGAVEVSEVMTPRTEMVCLDVEEPFSKNLERAVKCGHSRIPVFRNSKDTIIGILYVKDLLKCWHRKDTIQLEKILREAHFVEPTRKIDELLQEFKSERFHIAIVRDEFGGTAGLITIEDVIEEIVGDITDEYETESFSEPVTWLAPDLVEVDATMRIDEFNDHLKGTIPASESYDTLGGFLFSSMGKIPRVGETFEYEDLVFEVTHAEERRIRRVRIRLPGRTTAARPTTS